MQPAKKFTFDTVFKEFEPRAVKPPPKPEEIDEEEVAPVEEIPTFSEEDLKAARNEGFLAGKEEGLTASMDTIEKQISATLGDLEKEITRLIGDQQEANEQASHLALSIAVSITRKMLPAMASKNAANEIEKVIGEIIPRIIKEPRISIRVHGDLETEINSRLKTLAETLNYQGLMTVHPDNEIEIGDCKLEWSNGGGERDTESLWRQVDDIIARHVDQDLTMPHAEEHKTELENSSLDLETTTET